MKAINRTMNIPLHEDVLSILEDSGYQCHLQWQNYISLTNGNIEIIGNDEGLTIKRNATIIGQFITKGLDLVSIIGILISLQVISFRKLRKLQQHELSDMEQDNSPLHALHPGGNTGAFFPRAMVTKAH